MWSEIEKIYNSLQDDISRFNFRKRLEYNLGNEDADALYALAMSKEDDNRHSFYTFLKNRKNYEDNYPVVIFGCGRWGHFYKKVIEDYNVGKIVAWCDNKTELQGTVSEELPVLSVEDACARFKDALYVLGSVFYNDAMTEQLTSLGVKKENIFRYLHSVNIYGEQYFDEEIIKPYGSEGVFIDGGCLNLEETRRFIQKNPEFKKVYAFEPEAKNFQVCLERKSKYLQDNDKVKIINKGLWSEETRLHFIENKGSSYISSSGESVIETISIDTFMKEKEKVSFIKMDIEGAELEALKGARETIKRDKPNLAISIYHKNEDILEIPKYILELNPEYKLYIRHYSCYKWEMVLYAI